MQNVAVLPVKHTEGSPPPHAHVLLLRPRVSPVLRSVTLCFIFLLGKQMIETYFDFRLYRLWKTRQHSKLLDYDDIL